MYSVPCMIWWYGLVLLQLYEWVFCLSHNITTTVFAKRVWSEGIWSSHYAEVKQVWLRSVPRREISWKLIILHVTLSSVKKRRWVTTNLIKSAFKVVQVQSDLHYMWWVVTSSLLPNCHQTLYDFYTSSQSWIPPDGLYSNLTEVQP